MQPKGFRKVNGVKLAAAAMVLALNSRAMLLLGGGLACRRGAAVRAPSTRVSIICDEVGEPGSGPAPFVTQRPRTETQRLKRTIEFNFPERCL